MVRRQGQGHSAAIHATDPAIILDYGAGLNVLRIAVNVGSRTGAAGFDTFLAPTMTIGTGYFGRSSVSENVGPQHLVQWVKIAYNKRDDVPFGDFSAAELPAPATRPRPPEGEIDYSFDWVGGRPSPVSGGPHGGDGNRGQCPRGNPPDHPRRAARPPGRAAAVGDGDRPLLHFHRPAAAEDDVLSGHVRRGFLPRSNMAALVIEVSPGLEIENLTDVAVKTVDVKPGPARGRAAVRLSRVPRVFDGLGEGGGRGGAGPSRRFRRPTR